jgi:hypothetical protein
MKEPKTESASSAQSADASTPPVVNQSPEVTDAQRDAQKRARKDALDDIAIKIGAGVKNSCDWVATHCMADRPDEIRRHYQLLVDRLAEVHTLLAAQIENLPTIPHL